VTAAFLLAASSLALLLAAAQKDASARTFGLLLVYDIDIDIDMRFGSL